MPRTPRCFFCSDAFLHTLRFPLCVSAYRVCFSSRYNNFPLYNFSPLCSFPHSFSVRINRTYRPFAFCFSPRFLTEFFICCLFSFVSFCSKNFFPFRLYAFLNHYFRTISSRSIFAVLSFLSAGSGGLKATSLSIVGLFVFISTAKLPS